MKKVIDWRALEEKAARMSHDELSWAIADCREASAAMREVNPDLSNYYSDEATVYARERNSRALKTPTDLTMRELRMAIARDQDNAALIHEYCRRRCLL
jgi:hypothetical protein